MKPLQISHKVIFFLLLSLTCSAVFAQSDSLRPVSADSVAVRKAGKKVNADTVAAALPDSLTQRHSPGKAALYSTLLPGLGQVYNRKIWKVPIVYAALGTTVYFIDYNHGLYRTYLDAFYQRIDSNQTDQFGQYSERQLIELQNFYRKYRDLSIIIGAVMYGLQVLDAYVDAHLFYYDISDKLSLQWEPRMIRNTASSLPAMGVGLSFTLK